MSSTEAAILSRVVETSTERLDHQIAGLILALRIPAGDRDRTEFLSGCPLHYTGNRGSGAVNVMGTPLLSVLAGHWRYAHINGVCGDGINPGLLGMEHTAALGLPGLWQMLEGLPRPSWPTFARGDCGFGNENIMVEFESRALPYLFKLRHTPKVKPLVQQMLRTGAGWPLPSLAFCTRFASAVVGFRKSGKENPGAGMAKEASPPIGRSCVCGSAATGVRISRPAGK